MSCPYLKDNMCSIATELAGILIPANKNTCRACMSQSNPMSINKVTKGLAVATLLVARLPVPVTLHNIQTEIPRHGPGTELKKLVSWFVWLRDIADCQSCYNREQQMNQWGPEGCRLNITTIVEWLRESAAKHSLPFSETLVKIIINKAIRNSEKHYEMVRSSNNSTT